MILLAGVGLAISVAQSLLDITASYGIAGGGGALAGTSLMQALYRKQQK